MAHNFIQSKDFKSIIDLSEAIGINWPILGNLGLTTNLGFEI